MGVDGAMDGIGVEDDEPLERTEAASQRTDELDSWEWLLGGPTCQIAEGK